MTAALIGVVLALTVCAFDPERSFYPTVMIVIASYYALFAVMGGSTPALMRESAVTAAYLAVLLVKQRPHPRPNSASR